MPNPVHTYILNMTRKHILSITYIIETELFLYTVKGFQVLLYNSHNLTSVLSLHIVSSVWPIERKISGVTTSGHMGPGSNDNEAVFGDLGNTFHKSSTKPTYGLISYPRHLLGGRPTPSEEMQSVYSTAPAVVYFVKL